MPNNDPESTQSLSVYDVVAMMLDQMAAISWQKLGLQPDPMTGQLDPDMAQAKVAIDLSAHLAQTIEHQLDAEDRRRINGLVRDLRINYVQKSAGSE